MQYPHVPYVRPACLKRSDCPAPDNIPTCILPRPALTLEQVRANSDVLRDHVVTIRAPLSVPIVRSTLAGCPGACCNARNGGVALNLGSAPDRFVVRLWNYRERGRFGCAGDDLLLCCGIPIDGRTVLSTGVLREIEHSDDFQLQPGWYLDDAEVCVQP